MDAGQTNFRNRVIHFNSLQRNQHLGLCQDTGWVPGYIISEFGIRVRI